MSLSSSSGSAGAVGSRTAVVAFLGDARREAREKHLPARFLSAVHRRVAQSVRNLPDADLLLATHSGGLFRIERNGAFLSADASTLAEQVDQALRACFRDGYQRVLLLAGDIADSPAAELRAAISLLETDAPRMALGRSSDGGFYLAGFNALPELDWSAVPWHTGDAADAVTRLAAVAGLEEVRLPPLDDIDSLSEAWRLLSLPSRDARTHRAKRKLLSILAQGVPLAAPEPATPPQRSAGSSSLRAPPSHLS